MKAICYKKYGSTAFLELKDVEKPVPKADEVLIKIHAASVNSWDWDLVLGRPYIVRLGGLFTPKYKILGADIAGRVEAVGANIKRLKPGDEVFGDISEAGWGGFAEYVCVSEKPLAFKPSNMSFEQAAAFPQAGVLALQGLCKHGPIQKGQKILINGAGGGVGTLAIQLAKFFGAEVTAVDHTNKLAMLKSLGADHVIDYTKKDFTQTKLQYDLVLDVVAQHRFSEYKQVLGADGALVIVGGSMPLIFRLLLFGNLISKFHKRKLGLLFHKPKRKDLDYLAGLFQAEKLEPIIDQVFPLEKTAEAIQYLGEGRVQGKAVIKM